MAFGGAIAESQHELGGYTWLWVQDPVVFLLFTSRAIVFGIWSNLMDAFAMEILRIDMSQYPTPLPKVSDVASAPSSHRFATNSGRLLHGYDQPEARCEKLFPGAESPVCQQSEGSSFHA